METHSNGILVKPSHRALVQKFMYHWVFFYLFYGVFKVVIVVIRILFIGVFHQPGTKDVFGK